MPKFTFNLPDIGEGIAEAEIVAWHVKVGDMISEDQPLADMMTDKATVEMESPVTGVVTKVAGEAGDVIAIGAMLVEIEVAGEAKAEVAEATPRVPEPAAAVVEDENSYAPEPVFVAEVTPTSVATASAQPAAPAAETPGKVMASPAVRQRAKELGVDLTDVKAAGGHIRHADLDAFLSYGTQMGYRPVHATARRADQAVKVIGMRRRIADNMAASKAAMASSRVSP